MKLACTDAADKAWQHAHKPPTSVHWSVRSLKRVTTTAYRFCPCTLQYCQPSSSIRILSGCVLQHWHCTELLLVCSIYASEHTTLRQTFKSAVISHQYSQPTWLAIIAWVGLALLVQQALSYIYIISRYLMMYSTGCLMQDLIAQTEGTADCTSTHYVNSKHHITALYHSVQNKTR